MPNVLLLNQMLHVKEKVHSLIREIRLEPRVENNVRGPLYREFAHLRQFPPHFAFERRNSTDTPRTENNTSFKE